MMPDKRAILALAYLPRSEGECMPTDVIDAFERRRLAERELRQTHCIGVLLFPAVGGLLSILLTTQSHAFACAVIAMAVF